MEKYYIEHDEINASWKIYLDGEKIGNFDYYEDEAGKTWAFNFSIDELHQKKGIGTGLIKRAIDYYEEVYFYIGSKDDLERFSELGESDSRYLSIEGAALLNSCIRKGIIKPEWAINPFQKRTLEWE